MKFSKKLQPGQIARHMLVQELMSANAFCFWRLKRGPHRICILTFEISRRLFFRAVTGCDRVDNFLWALFGSKPDDQPTFGLHLERPWLTRRARRHRSVCCKKTFRSCGLFAFSAMNGKGEKPRAGEGSYLGDHTWWR